MRGAFAWARRAQPNTRFPARAEPTDDGDSAEGGDEGEGMFENPLGDDSMDGGSASDDGAFDGAASDDEDV